MPLNKVTIRPGINRQFTPTLNMGGYSYSQFIRFKDGLAQKYGGWQKLLNTPVIGIARGCHAWADLSGNPYLAIGTDQRLEVYSYGQLYDITPIRATTNPSPNFDTTSGSATVHVHDVANDAAEGDWINITVQVSIGGLILYGLYQVQSIVGVDEYTITAASLATSTVSAGGAVPAFTSTNTSASISVALNNHGLSIGQEFPINVSTTIATVVLLGSYFVDSVTNANHFVFIADTVANASTTVSENSGNTRIRYLLPSGYDTAVTLSGYGIGDYGAGDYGLADDTGGYTTIRQWYLDNWGENLQGNPTNGTLYQWIPPDTSIPATAISGAPTMMTASFVSMPAQIAVALGAETGGTQDPNLVRWSDVGDNTDWVATTVNQAGSFRIPTGSHIVGGMVVGQSALIWTDVDAWSMTYQGYPFVFSFNKIAPDCELIAGHAMAVVGNDVYWMSQHGFFRYGGGGVQKIPCTIWDLIYNNLNLVQKDKIFAASNRLFGEWTIYYCSQNSDEIDSYAKLNIDNNLVWDYGTLSSASFVRTTWADASVIDHPVGVDGSGYLQQHEVSPDADGMPMNEYIQTGYFDISDGTLYVFIERCIPDFVWTGSNPSILMYVYVTDYPGSDPATYGPYTITSTTKYIIVRARGRQASVKFQGTGIGTWWRMGAIRYLSAPSGRR